MYRFVCDLVSDPDIIHFHPFCQPAVDAGPNTEYIRIVFHQLIVTYHFPFDDPVIARDPDGSFQCVDAFADRHVTVFHLGIGLLGQQSFEHVIPDECIECAELGFCNHISDHAIHEIGILREFIGI